MKLPEHINQTRKYLILYNGKVLERFRQKTTALCWLPKLQAIYGKNLRIVEKNDVIKE